MSSRPVDITLADALREYREQRVLTQQELARKLRIPVRSLQGYEAGAIPQAARRRKILAFLERERQAA